MNCRCPKQSGEAVPIFRTCLVPLAFGLGSSQRPCRIALPSPRNDYGKRLSGLVSIIMGLGFLLGLAGLENNFVLAQEAPPELPVQTTTPQAAPQETSGQAEKTAVSPETSPLETQPVMEIQRLDTEEPLYSFELRDVEVGDLFRVLAHDYKLNLLVDKELSGTVTASLNNISLEEALNSIAEAKNLKLEKKGNIIWVKPNILTRIFILKHLEAKALLAFSASTAAASSALTSSEATSASSTTTSTIYDLLSDKGKVFLGKQPNSLVVIDYPSQLKNIEDYLAAIDRKMESRLFKLKYLKAKEITGTTSTTSSSTSTTTAASAGTSAAASGTSSSSGSSGL